MKKFRDFAIVFHRWTGLFLAVFLIMNGLTGAVITWDHALDEVLNPHLLKIDSVGESIDPTLLAKDIESRDPRVQVTYVQLLAEPGHSLGFWAEPLVDPDTGQLYKLGYNQVYYDQVTGEQLGTREWGSVWPVTRENFLSFLYKLHYSLHFPEFMGMDKWGIWFLGIVAFIWTIDCFTGFYLTLPIQSSAKKSAKHNGDRNLKRKTYWDRWKPAWKIRRNKGPHVLNFDLHRAFGLWTWVLLFVIAFTGFSLNFYQEIFYPLTSKISNVTPTPFDTRQPTGPLNPIIAKLSFSEAVAEASEIAQSKGWSEPVGSLGYAREFGIYRVNFYWPDADHGVGGAGHKAIYIDSQSGEYLGDRIPWTGTFADLFVQAQYPLHSGRILGIPGRILISIMGIVIAGLSLTGVLIWLRKYKARKLKALQI